MAAADKGRAADGGASLRRVAVIGGGAWGTALAESCRRSGREVLLWARESEVAAAINTEHANPYFLPNVRLDPALRATTSLAEAARTAELLLLVTPAQVLRGVATELAPALGGRVPVVVCAKGIERGTLALMTEVAAAVLPGRPLAVLSGPTFAAEVGRGQPAAVTLACTDPALGGQLVAALGSRTFRPYFSGDPVGAQIGGAVKNVLAIACGIVDGRGFGDNARAALITRSLAEITRLGLALGAHADTIRGLSGLGDLVLTCSSRQSRNMSLGVALGQGRSLAECLGERQTVAEGVHSAAAVVALASRHGIEMPIAAAVDAVLNHGAAIDQMVESLLARPFRDEEA